MSIQPATAGCAFMTDQFVCTQTDAGGFEATRADTVIIIRPTATVSADDEDAIKVKASGLTVINAGTISSTHNDAIQSYSGLSVTNTGIISAGDEGITADDPPQNPYSNAVIHNTGQITAHDDAIKIGARGTIMNFGLIENVGTDTDDPQDAIDIDSGVIINHASGIIRSTLDAAIDFDPGDGYAYISNAGVIDGTVGVLTDEGNAGVQEVLNMGIIRGSSGTALDLGHGHDAVSLLVGGRFHGDVLLGDGGDIFALGAGSFRDMSGEFIVNGGRDDDTLDFNAFGTLKSLVISPVAVDTYDISLASDTSDATLRFTSIESFLLQGETLTLQQVQAFEITR